MPTASGMLTMMKFTMSSLTLAGGVMATVTQNGQTTVTTNSPLVPVTMTGVTTDDFLVASDNLQANDLNITPG